MTTAKLMTFVSKMFVLMPKPFPEKRLTNIHKMHRKSPNYTKINIYLYKYNKFYIARK